MNYKIAISIGHHPKAPGFSIGHTSEYQEMASVAGFLISAIQGLGHEAYLIGSRPLDQKVVQVNNILGHADCAIELHLNAGGGVGYETLFCPGSTEGESLACHVHKSIGTILGSRDRGIKEGWYKMDEAQGPNYFLKMTNCPSIITEAYFLDNEDERDRYAGNTHFYYAFANKIAGGIILYLNGLECG